MKQLLKILLIIEGIVILPSMSFSKENKVEYDNYYVDYVYNNYLKNKRKQPYEIETTEENITEETSLYGMPISSVTGLKNETKIKGTEKTNQTQISSKETKTEETKNPYRFYAGLGLGISKLNDYDVLQPAYSQDKATMEPDDSSNAYINFGINNIFKDFMSLEFELGYAENEKIPTPHENGVYLIDYNQNLKTYNIGANLIFNILDINSMFIPYIGFGLGMAKLELSDFGIIVQDDIPANFKSKSESKNTFYGKITAGVMYSMNETSKFVIGADYIMYNDVDYKYISLQDLSRINFTAGLKFYF